MLRVLQHQISRYFYPEVPEDPFEQSAASDEDFPTTVPDCITSPSSRELFARLQHRIQAGAAPQVLASLRSQQNTLFPVNRLSDDILFRVFSLLVQPISIRQHPGASSDFLDVLRAAQVCSRWRTIAASPSLWVNIPVRTVEQTRELLSRSASAPVRLSAHVRKHSSYERSTSQERRTSQEMRAFLSPHFHRVEVLKLYDYSDASDMGGWIPWLARSFLQLKALALTLVDARMYSLNKAVPDSWPCWKNAPEFGSRMPALHSLSLDGVFFTPGSPIFRNLRDLRLSRQPAGLLNSTVVARIVGHALQLEELTVEDVGMPSIEKEIQNTSLSTSLPRLRTLTVHGVPQWFPGNLLDALSLPPTARVDLRVSMWGDTALIPIPRFTSGYALTCVGTRSFECIIGTDSARVTFCTRRDPAARNPDLVLAVDTMDVWRVLAVFTECRLVDGSGIERYTLRYGGHKDAPKTLGWKALLAEMGRLSVLTVVNSPEEHLLELLDALWLDQRGAEWGRCTSLEEIRLRGVAFTRRFWRKLRAVARTRQPTLRTIRISDARGSTQASHDIVRELAGLVESFELEQREDASEAKESFEGDSEEAIVYFH